MYEHRALPIYTHKKKSVNLVPCMNIPRSYTNKEDVGGGPSRGMMAMAVCWHQSRTNTRLRAIARRDKELDAAPPA